MNRVEVSKVTSKEARCQTLHLLFTSKAPFLHPIPRPDPSIPRQGHVNPPARPADLNSPAIDS